MTRISAQNSQYSSTGVGFQIRNDLYAHISAGYPLFPSQAPASGRTHTCMCARKSTFFLQICRRSRRHVVVNANSMRNNIVPTSFSMPMQPLCDFNFTHSQVHFYFMPSTAKLRRNHCTSTTQCLPINFTTTLQHLPLDQADPNSLPKNCPDNTCRSLEVHLRVTCDIDMLSTYNRRVQSGHNRGSLAARPKQKQY